MDFTGRYRFAASGDWRSGEYDSPFAALSSLALHAVKRGVSEGEFVDGAWRAGSALRKKTRPYGEEVARKAYRQAVAFSKGRPRGGSQKGFQRWVEASAMWLFRFDNATWRGRGSSAERKVLAALTERALRARSLAVNASGRLLAEETLLPHRTVEGALGRLVAAGWISLDGSEVGKARVANLITAGVDVFDALLAVYESNTGLDVTPGEVPVSRTDEVVFSEGFARAGVNRHHGFIHAAGVEGVTTREVADGQGLTVVTARRHLHDLVAAGLVRREGRRWVATDVTVEQVAASETLPGVPTVGLRERMRAAHAKERWSYAEYLRDCEQRLRVRKIVPPAPVPVVTMQQRTRVDESFRASFGGSEDMLEMGRKLGLLLDA